MMPDPAAIHGAIAAVLEQTPVISVFRGHRIVAVDPLTVEETRLLAPLLTAAVLSVLTEGASAA